jgi:prepilin-type N-terminal cleavage/methylation domain-containing protein/prepilin-type processing-associated H-X9-DG protein
MKKRLVKGKKGFTLLEILVVIAILGTLLGMSFPVIMGAIAKGQSALCASNLRNIGVAVNNAVNDNNGIYPPITQGGSLADYPSGYSAQTLYVTLQPYGITPSTLLCPLDKGSPTYASQNPQNAPATPVIGCSYEWSPVADEENSNAVVVYTRNGMILPMNSGKTRLCMDGVGWHHGKMNRLYADGHVIQN